MKEKINQINQSIDEKRNRLMEKAERYFASIIIPSNSTLQQRDVTANSGNVPPIAYILYGIAGLSAVGALATDSKVLCLGVAAASAFGGYKLSKRTTNNTVSTQSSNINVSSLKNEVASKVLDSVKKLTQEWDEFMELKQREVQSAISSSSFSDSEKDSMSSKVFIYEVIDISISEFSSMMNRSSNMSEIKNSLTVYKENVISAINHAANEQILKYKLLVS